MHYAIPGEVNLRYIEAASSGKEEQPKAEQVNAKGPDGMIRPAPLLPGKFAPRRVMFHPERRRHRPLFPG